MEYKEKGRAVEVEVLQRNKLVNKIIIQTIQDNCNHEK